MAKVLSREPLILAIPKGTPACYPYPFHREIHFRIDIYHSKARSHWVTRLYIGGLPVAETQFFFPKRGLCVVHHLDCPDDYLAVLTAAGSAVLVDWP